MGAALAILAAAQTALDRISDMRTLAGALEVNADVPLLLLLTSSACADCRFLAMGFGEAASLAPRARFATAVEENDISTSFGVTGVPHVSSSAATACGDPERAREQRLVFRRRCCSEARRPTTRHAAHARAAELQ